MYDEESPGLSIPPTAQPNHRYSGFRYRKDVIFDGESHLRTVGRRRMTVLVNSTGVGTVLRKSQPRSVEKMARHNGTDCHVRILEARAPDVEFELLR